MVLCCTLHGAPTPEAHALLETGRRPDPGASAAASLSPTLEPDGIGLGDIGESPTTAVLYWLPAVVDASKLDPARRALRAASDRGEYHLRMVSPLILDEHLCTPLHYGVEARN